MAAMRLNSPTIFVSGGPMEAGLMNNKKVDFIDAVIMGGNDSILPEELEVIERNACPTCGSCAGLFTANSMNCLTEALGLAFPGNGTIVATHKNRINLFSKAAKRIVELTKMYYENGDTSILPKNIATREAFLNSMSLDIAMGGSTNTILHLLAIANEAGVNFTLKDIDELSKKIPCLCKVSPSSKYHIEDVNKAGGIMAILGELDRGKLIDTTVKRIDNDTLEKSINEFDIRRKTATAEAFSIYKSAPGQNYNYSLGSQGNEHSSLDTNRENGCIRSIEHAYSKDGGLAVLFGNIARNGCVVKTAGIDPSIFSFKGNAITFSSQEEAVHGILNGKVKEGDVVIIRYEGPKGGPGMQEMLYPTSYLTSKNLDKKCALITDGRFSGGSAGLSIGHISPEAAAGGEIALIRDGDIIEIDIDQRKINVLLNEDELLIRKKQELSKDKNAFKPADRKRYISNALKFYALHVSSADKGAVRLLENENIQKPE
jgi:dihydroxy-acid dehydratase